MIASFMTKPPAMSNPSLVFMCHSSGDKTLVRDLHRRLVADGINCWLDENDILPGQNWPLEIKRAIGRASHVLACLSQDSVTKTGYVNRELKFALECADERPEGAIFLIPVRVELCRVPDRLQHLQHVDLFETDGYLRLLKVLRST